MCLHLGDLFLLREYVPLSIEFLFELDHLLDGDTSTILHQLLDIDLIVLHDLFDHIWDLHTFDGPREEVC